MQVFNTVEEGHSTKSLARYWWQGAGSSLYLDLIIQF